MTTGQPTPGARASWTYVPAPRSEARVRLYCLPFLGAPAAFYAPLGDALPAAEARAIEIPGHGRRAAEPAVRDLRELIRTLAEVVRRDAAGRGIALFGHCSGGLLAYEVARQLSPGPVLLAVSAAWAPRRWEHLIAANRSKPLSLLLPLVAEVAWDTRLYSAAWTALARAEVPTYLAYRHREGAPVDCPIAAFGGRGDTAVEPRSLDDWAAYTTGRTTVRLYSGRHFYLRDHWAHVARDLARELADAPPPG
ncbi:alpha/beta fold hydrolase [Streptomyces sp. B1866]|uniref:thioesterase II family protein n=1 Tax=Streptomyces sp. B1866 TaxID=3075431 RepID=UPI002890E831|nr:alpha/beta fold hydrolase [Streptomyces sp. B1866]MDT3397737.1 alpha/beta fold hydrolase [Streptomyces sp. B1866]